MLKGNLIVGKTQSVVVHAESLHDLIKLAESKSRDSNCSESLSLRVDLAENESTADVLFTSRDKPVGKNPGRKEADRKKPDRKKPG